MNPRRRRRRNSRPSLHPDGLTKYRQAPITEETRGDHRTSPAREAWLRRRALGLTDDVRGLLYLCFIPGLMSRRTREARLDVLKKAWCFEEDQQAEVRCSSAVCAAKDGIMIVLTWSREEEPPPRPSKSVLLVPSPRLLVLRECIRCGAQSKSPWPHAPELPFQWAAAADRARSK